MKKKKTFRDSITGEKVSAEYAAANPDTTQSETSVTLKQAVKLLAKTLKKDETFYFAWQSNIVSPVVIGLNAAGINDERIFEIANQAAQNFLNELIAAGEIDMPERKD